MTLRDKARAIKEAGEESRKDWTPKEGTVTLRLYQYWALHKPRKVPTRENFCHYWRVVMFWAPLLGVKRGLSNFMATRTFIVLLVAASVSALVYLGAFAGMWYIPAVLAFAVWVAAGFAMGLGMYERDEDMDKLPLKTLSIATAPISYTILGIGRLHDNWRSEWSRRAGYVGVGLLACAVVLLGWLLFATVPLHIILVIAAGIIAGAVVGFVLILLASFVGDTIGAWRRARRKARDEKWAAMTPEEKDEYIRALHEPIAEIPSWVRAIGRGVRAFFVGFADVLVLVGQAVRVNKWKICPIVEIPKSPAQVARENKIAEDSWHW